MNNNEYEKKLNELTTAVATMSVTLTYVKDMVIQLNTYVREVLYKEFDKYVPHSTFSEYRNKTNDLCDWRVRVDPDGDLHKKFDDMNSWRIKMDIKLGIFVAGVTLLSTMLFDVIKTLLLKTLGISL